MPPTLRDILGARLDALPEQAKEVLRIAAAAGRRVDHRLLEQVADLDASELEAGLRAAVEHQALVPDADGFGYRFRHALFQEAVHEQLLPGERTRLHAAFADALAREPGPGRRRRRGCARRARPSRPARARHRPSVRLAGQGRQAGTGDVRLRRGAAALREGGRAARAGLGLRPATTRRRPGSCSRTPPTAPATPATSARPVAHLRRAISLLDPARDPLAVGGLHGELSEASGCRSGRRGGRARPTSHSGSSPRAPPRAGRGPRLAEPVAHAARALPGGDPTWPRSRRRRPRGRRERWSCAARSTHLARH